MNERGAISKRNVTVERDYYRFSFAGFHFRFSLFRASRTNSLFSSRRLVPLEISRFLYRNSPPPPAALEISRQTHRRAKLAGEIELETRVTSETAGIDQVWAWSKRKVAIENKLGARDLVSPWLDNCECTDKLRGGCATFNYRTWTPFTIIWAPCIRGWGRPLSDAPRGPRMARSYYIITPIDLDWSISWSA